MIDEEVHALATSSQVANEGFEILCVKCSRLMSRRLIEYLITIPFSLRKY